MDLPTIDVAKYGGQQVAILDGQVIASGVTLKELVARVRELVPKRPLFEVAIFSVPRSLAVIYHVSPLSLRPQINSRRRGVRLSRS